MAQQGEGVEPNIFSKEMDLPLETQYAFGEYRKTAEETRRAIDTMGQIEMFIGLVNGGWLPKGHMVLTETQSQSSVSMIDEAQKAEARKAGFPEQGTVIYRRDPDPRYSRFIPDGELVTWGATRPFLGDYMFRTDEGDLVLVNKELQVGITVNGRVLMVPTSKFDSEFLDETMPLIEEVRDGAQQSFDLGR